jgi:hypothetical protein
MGIKRYENLAVNNVVNGIDSFGQYTTTLTKWFDTRGLVADVSNSVRISERYRVYQDLVNITLNYTPNMKQMVDNQNLYSITWRGFDWRITDVRESNDRMRVTFICYRNDPSTPV